jgi:hypothetical protein
MLAIRYVTLAALVVWLGGLVTLTLVVGPSVEDLRRLQVVGSACGGIMFVGLVVVKFVGPPPRAFFPRLGLVALMLAVALVGRVWTAVPAATIVDMTLGFVLLFWYLPE